MNKNNIINLVIVSLNEKLGKNTARSLAEKLDMFVADCHSMIVYDLINPKEVIEKCGLEYFKKRERGVIKNCAQYNNSIISINFELYKEYYSLFQNSLAIYLKVDKEKVSKVVNKLEFENRNFFLNENSDFIIELDKNSAGQATKKIIDKLGELYENRR